MDIYMNRILPWLQFTGLIDFEQPERIIRQSGPGKAKGKIILRHKGRSGSGKSTFLCSSSPSRAVDLATLLCGKGILSRKYILNTANRNAAQDLVSLGLAHWKHSELFPLGELSPGIDFDQCLNIIKKYSMDSVFLKSLKRELDNFPKQNYIIAMNSIEKDLNKKWQPSSVKRHFNAGKSWLKFFNELPLVKRQPNLYDY